MSIESAARLWQAVGAVPDGENHAVYDCNGLHIHMQYDQSGDSLLLYVHLGFLPEHPARQTYEYMLELNFMGAKLGGGHVGLHGRSRSLVYSLRLDVAQQNALSLQNALHLFAGYALTLLEVKRQGRTATAQAPAAANAEEAASLPKTEESAPAPGKGVVWG